MLFLKIKVNNYFRKIENEISLKELKKKFCNFFGEVLF